MLFSCRNARTQIHPFNRLSNALTNCSGAIAKIATQQSANSEQPIVKRKRVVGEFIAFSQSESSTRSVVGATSEPARPFVAPSHW
ncbi:MAG TPA: hypothetical protein V6D33_12300 [Cyanophyceae cyanobacterium]